MMTRGRDLRIDLLRGIALITIFIDHIPGTFWEKFTIKNFGFSDAAEAFVLLSGISAGLAYGPAVLARPTLTNSLRPWFRAFTLWWVQALVVFVITLIIALNRDSPAIAAMGLERNIDPVLNNPMGMLVPLLLLGHQYSCADILPLYIVLMLATPAILALAVRKPLLLLATSIGLWLFASVGTVNLPTWPLHEHWFFNPLAWQVLFVIGILVGISKRSGRQFAPAHPVALLIAVMFLIFALIWTQLPMVSDWGEAKAEALQRSFRVPNSFIGFDKTSLFMPRLLHVLALAYVLSTMSSLQKLAASRFTAGLRLLGRSPLPVFAASSVLAYVAQMIRVINPASNILDTALLLSGIFILFVVAKLRDIQRVKHVTRKIALSKEVCLFDSENMSSLTMAPHPKNIVPLFLKIDSHSRKNVTLFH